MVLPGLIAAFIGAIAWRGSLWTIPLSVVFPVLVFMQPNRTGAGAVAFAYFAAASWPMMSSARAFWSLPATSPLPPVAWLTASALLTVPWFALWHSGPRAAMWRSPVALIINVIPPLGLIGWASPLTAAGVLFPGTGWLGLLAMLLLPGLLLTRRLVAAMTSALLCLTLNLVTLEPQRPADWAAINTSIDTAKRNDPIVDFEAIQEIQTHASATQARLILAPESAVMRWNEATTGLWQPTIDALRRRGATLLIGTTTANPGSLEYQNLLLALGTTSATFTQRNPVPFAMWKPFGPKDGTSLRLTGRGTLDLGDQRAAVLICYEQLLVWPILHSVLENPTIILGIANDYWCRTTHIPKAQRACMRAWARLFSLPWLAAVNE